MPTIVVNKIPITVPDNATTDYLLHRIGEEGEAVVYQMHPDDSHEIMPNQQPLNLKDGDRFGSITPFRTGARIIFDGIPIDVPDSATTDSLLRDVGADREAAVYLRHPDGSQEVLSGQQPLNLKDGDRFGSITPFRTGGCRK